MFNSGAGNRPDAQVFWGAVMKNGDLPAMPNLTANGVPTSERELFELLSNNRVTIGLTKREMFAMAAMQACRSRHSNYPSWESLSKDAVEIADALLTELERAK